MGEQDKGLLVVNVKEHQEQAALQAYFDRRFEREDVFKSSGFARNLPDERRPGYISKMKQYAQEITSQLEMEPSLFEDERYCEAFFVACDSWLINETDPESPDYQQEKTFLFQYFRVLSGNSSKYNVKAFATQEEDAENYVMVEDTKEMREKRERFAKIKPLINEAETERIKKIMSEWGGETLLSEVRKNLFIGSASEEMRYRVLVINADRKNGTFNIETREDEGTEWESVTGSKSQTYVERDPDDLIATIVISSDYAATIGTEEQNERDVKALAHEYAHTQKQMLIGNYQLGHTYDEQMARLVSRGFGGYYDISLMFQIMNRLLQNKDSGEENPIYNVFRSSFKSVQDMAGFFRYISDNFGLRTSLLLLTVQPSGYNMDVITKIPGIDLDPNKKTQSMIDLILDERDKICPGVVDRLTERLRQLPVSEVIAIQTNAWMSAVKFPDKIETIILAKQSEWDKKI